MESKENKQNKIKSIYTKTRLLVTTVLLEGFPDSSDGKESACNTGDPGSIPGSGRSSGVRYGNSLQYSCLQNPMDREAWQAAGHGVATNRMPLNN